MYLSLVTLRSPGMYYCRDVSKCMMKISGMVDFDMLILPLSFRDNRLSLTKRLCCRFCFFPAGFNPKRHIKRANAKNAC
jgi:hypothetical protein